MPQYREGPLTPDNLLLAAPELRWMVGPTADGKVGPIEPEAFASAVLGSNPVGLPEEVDAYLRRARECMAYGGFYHPFMTIGFGQLGLTAEAAIRAYAVSQGLKAKQGNGTSKGFKMLIGELSKAGKLTDEGVKYWRAVADMRNYLSHPEQCPVFPLGSVLGALNDLTLAILQLFPDAAFPPSKGDLTNHRQN